MFEKILNIFSIYQVNLFLNPQSFLYLPGKSLVLKLTGVCRRHFCVLPNALTSVEMKSCIITLWPFIFLWYHL